MQPAVSALLHRHSLVLEMQRTHMGLDSHAQGAGQCTAFHMYVTCKSACGSRLHGAARSVLI